MSVPTPTTALQPSGPKPVRVIQQLTPTEQFIRAIERAKDIRDTGRARLDAEYVERIEDARVRFIAADPKPAAESA